MVALAERECKQWCRCSERRIFVLDALRKSAARLASAGSLRREDEELVDVLGRMGLAWQGKFASC